jgi:isoquinoline 1-oxidoreductase beta subunit
MATTGSSMRISRRGLLIGGGAGVGLLVAWAFWPRTYPPNLVAAPGESLFNAYLKIGVDGRVIVAVAQMEIGQGVYTSLPQILADELGADWRTVAVEAAPLSPIYANKLIAELTSSELTMTGGSTSIRAFEGPMRQAGAAARALLMKAAAERWNEDWETLDTAGGFVLNGPQRLSFASLAEEAAELDIPDELPVRGGPNNRLIGQSLPRIDLPAKVDGSAQFAGDVRLPDMVYASVRQGPRGNSRLVKVDKAAAEAVPGVLSVIEHPRWAAAVATNWWAANRGVEAMSPRFETRGAPNSGDIEAGLARTMEGEISSVFEQGDAAAALQGPRAFRAHYSVGLAPNLPLETLTATARRTGDRLEVWAPTQAPGLARTAAAQAAGLPEGQVTIYPMLIGSGYGRKLEMTAVEQAAIMAMKLERPVQLVWSRIEESLQDTFRPAARATISARLDERGAILGWQSRIAAPSTAAQVMERIGAKAGGEDAAVAGAVPPYAIPAVAVEQAVADLRIDTGLWRSGVHSYTAFFNECFVDELARKAGIEPFSFRMQMLGNNPRLARVLSTATALGRWDGGAPGSAMGIACHSAFASHVATLVEVEVSESQRVNVVRAAAAVDCGRVVNPDIVRQLIEGGIVYGIAGATGAPIRIESGLPEQRYLRDFELPRLADSPEVTVEILPSEEEPGGVTELGVPSVAPAIANALFALTGRRLRSLPLVLGSGA